MSSLHEPRCHENVVGLCEVCRGNTAEIPACRLVAFMTKCRQMRPFYKKWHLLTGSLISQGRYKLLVRRAGEGKV